MDRGNADSRAISRDFARLGLVRTHSAARRGDLAEYQDLIRLRNAVAHADGDTVDELRSRGLRDVVGWTRAKLPVLDRVAGDLDRAVWNHLGTAFRQEPW